MLDPAHAFDRATALVVVDVQNDFADTTGSLAVAGAEAVIPVVNRAVRQAIEAGSLVVVTQDWHPESTPHFAKDGGIWPVHCVAGTWGAELYPALEVPPDTPRVRKGANGEDGYSGFNMRHPVSGEERPTGLEGLLRTGDVRRVVIVGLATDYCVRATALDALARGLDVTVFADATAAVNVQAGDGARALEEMRQAGIAVD
jgi:nicotinamidase/pyrazinamidase